MTKLAIKKNILTISLIVVIVIMGVSVFQKMPRDDMPPFLVRVAAIVTSFPGASPQRVENLITDKIEKVIQEIPQVDYIQSESRTGLSIVNVFLKENEFDLRPIFDKIQKKVEEIQVSLPEGAMSEVKDELGDVFGIIVGLTAEGYSYSEMKEIADDIRDEMIKLPDAAKVEISGDQYEMVYIEFNDTRIAEIGLSMEKLRAVIATTNIIIPVGDIKIGDRRIILEPSGSFESLDDLKNLLVPTQSGQSIHLGDVTNIYRGYNNPQLSLNRINGERGLAIAINLKAGGNIVELGRQVDKLLNYHRQVYPHGVELVRVASQDLAVDLSVKDFLNNLIQSVVIVLLVMLFFLGLRTGFVVASLIPVTIVMTILVMSLMGIGLNKVTLASLIIALGMLVDNAIVVSESIMVRMENGAKAMDAAIDSSKELMVSLLTASMTTSAAFLAFYLAESIMAEIMGSIFVVVTIALVSSWFLSLTMITLFCIYFLKVKKIKKKKAGLFEKASVFYRRLLIYFLKKPLSLLVPLVVIFAFSIYMFKYIPIIFMPKSDRALVTVDIELPMGTTIERTDLVTMQIEKFIKENLLANKNNLHGVESWSSYIGEGAPKYDLGYTPGEANSNFSHILLNTTTEKINDQIIERLNTYIFKNFPDVKSKVSRLSTTGEDALPISIRISGKDIEKLYEISADVKQKLTEIEGTYNISDDWGPQTKKIVFNIHQSKAQLAGVTNADIAMSIQTVLTGSFMGEFRDGDKSLEVIMRNENANSLKIENLEGLNIFAQLTGNSVPLKQVADIEIAWQATKIKRRDLFKTISVSSDVIAPTTANEVISMILPWLDEQQEQWGSGYRFAIGGEAESMDKAMDAVTAKLPLSLSIIILLLIGQFNSIKKPFIIILAIPLGLIGVIWGLLITNSYFGFMGFLGIISLSGIVINNAIVLLDRIQIETTENGLKPQAAIIAASIQRFRPILLTTATTAFGLIPLWFGGGILWEPMAIGIIFGLLFATVLTLIFVPVMYRILYRVSYRVFEG